MDIKDFKNPAPIYRAAPFWSWNDKLEKDELTRQIQEMADKGWGGYFLHSRVGLVTEYLSDEWMDLVRACADKAGETNTYAWLYDEDKWPSGYAGGIIPKMNKEYRQRALVLLTEDEITDNDEVFQKVETEREDKKTYYICKRIQSMGNLWFNGTCYVDLMNPEMVKSYLEVTHEKYKEACGEYFGDEIPGIFTDEPCYLMNNHFKVPVLPWSEYLADFFKELKGYAIEDHLESLFFDKGDYQKIRYDFFDSATRLFLESFTKQYYDWCEENDLIMTGHFMAEDNLPYQTEWIGAAMPHYQYMHWPGIDKLGRHLQQVVTVKQVTSAADQLGKERSFCEVFGTSGQQVSFYDRKWIADWEAALGISFVNHHLSLYSMRGERKRDFPPNFFYQQPWWDQEKDFGDYIGRLSQAVATGTREVDVLVLHPIASVWSEYSPLNSDNNHMIERGIYDQPFEQLSRQLVGNHIDFHYGDEIIMENHALIEGDKLVVGEQSYSTVVVPPSLTLRQNTVELLKKFSQKNEDNNLIFVEPTPVRVEGEEKDIDFESKTVVRNVGECVQLLDENYDDRIQINDTMSGGNASSIIHQQRDVDGEKLLFMANTDKDREISTKISIPTKDNSQNPVIIDLMSGKRYALPVAELEGRIEFELTFYPSGSLLLLLTEEDYETEALPSVIDCGVGFREDIINESREEIIIEEKDWEVNILEDNVLPLNNVTLYMNGNKVMTEAPVAKAWHNYFYPADNGTSFRAEYSFEVKNKPEGKMLAAIEVAENLGQITLNGEELTPLKERGQLGAFNPEESWKDINFTRVPLADAVQEGKNVLVLEGKKENNITDPNCHIRVEDVESHEPTEVEAVYIVGDFEVENIDDKVFRIDGDKDAITTSRNLTREGYPFYAGKVEYKATIDSGELASDADKSAEKELLLKVNKVEAACINMYVNNKQVGVKYWEPYIYNIADNIEKGANEIKIVAATTLFNLTGPNWISGIKDDKGVSPHTFVNFSRYSDKLSFFPFGIGNVTEVK